MSTTKESFEYCRRLARTTARNFYFSFLALPRNQRPAMCALYAFMRICDDLGDDPDVPIPQRRRDLQQWRLGLERALAGSTNGHPAFPAVAATIREYQIPAEHLFSVVQGVEMDLDPVGFETFADLAHYCYHVAGAVGLCCIHVWGFRDDRALDAAIDCGVAFQLTNILRDLGEDAAGGRIYLPREDLVRFGYSAEDLADRRRDSRFVELMDFEIERTKAYYARAERLFDLLEPAGRPILDAMLDIYGGLLRKIERGDYNVFKRRIQLSTLTKLRCAGAAMLRQRFGRRPPARFGAGIS